MVRFTTAATEELRRREAAEAAQMIADAHKAKRVLDWLESHGCVSTPGFFWDGSCSLADAAMWRMSEAERLEMEAGNG